MRREALGERIERLRTLTELSPRALALLAGLHASHIYRIEATPSERVSAGTLRLIANVFGVTLDWLFDGKGEQPSAEMLRSAVLRAQRARSRGGTVKAA